MSPGLATEAQLWSSGARKHRGEVNARSLPLGSSKVNTLIISGTLNVFLVVIANFHFSK